jgi:zinc protease
MSRRLVDLALLGAFVLAACGSASPPPQAPPASAPAPAAAAPPPPAAPVAPDPAPVADGDVTVAWMHGMQILVKRDPTAELVAAHLYVRGGVRNWTKETAGVEALALGAAAAGGTKRLPKDAFARRLATLGSSIGAESGNDYSVVAAKSLKRHWEETFALMTEALLQPALPKEEIELQRQLLISALRQELEEPDARLGLRLHETLYQGHPYARRASGTIPNLRRFAARDLHDHLARLRETSRLVLVVVGDVDPAQVVAQARARLGKLPRGSYREQPLAPVTFAKPRLVTFTEKLPTNYIVGVFPGPRRADPDYAAAVVAMQILDWRVYEEVRTKRSLSYAPDASLRSGSALTTGALYVSTVDPNAAWKVMLAEARKLQQEPVTPTLLAGAKSVFLTRFLMGAEGTDGQAALLARALLLGGDWHLSRTLPDRVRTVTAADVQGFARRAIRNLQTVQEGNPAKLDRALFTSL